MRGATTVLAGALALAATALPAERLPGDDWTETETAHFTLYSQASKSKTRETTESLLGMYLVMEHLGIDVGADRGHPITFVLFADEDAFEPYMLSPPGRGIVQMSEIGRIPGRSYVLLNGGRRTSEFLPWALSAYAATIIRSVSPRMPFWLQRGLASFYASIRFERNAVRLGLPLRDALDDVRRHSMIPLGQFFRVGPESLNDPATVRIHRAQSWLIAHFLMTGGDDDPAKGRSVYRQVLQGVSSEAAIRTAYGTDMAGFERKLTAYARSGSMPYFTLDRDLFELPPASAEPMPAEEITFQLGLFLAAAHDPPPLEITEAHLEPLAAEGARRGDALAALAELRRRSGRTGEAAELFDRALEAGPREAISHYHLGRYRDESGDRAAARQAFERATEIEPAFVEAWLALAETYDPFADASEATPAMRRALELAPDRGDIAYNLAVLHLNQGQTAAARSVVETHLGGANDRSRREQLLRQVARAEAVQALNAASKLAADDPGAAAEDLRQALETVTDPALRRQVEEHLAAIEARAALERQRAAYDRAFAHYDAGDYAAARAALDAMGPIGDPGLRRAVDDLRKAIDRRSDG